MTSRWLAVLLLVFTAVAGCSANKHFSEDFGQSYQEGFSAQIANPTAPVDTLPADTLPGEISDRIYQQRYVKSMTAELDADDDGGQSQSINTLK